MKIEKFKPSVKRFRAWDNVNKTFPFIGFDILGETTVFDLCKQYRLKDALALVITQYTGINDITGREIYEGDILGTSDGLILVEFPNFAESKWAFMFPIVGNVFENPNLI
jgi:hypothetical protein